MPGHLVHHLLDDLRGARVEGIDALARLEVHVGVLRGTADEGSLGGQRPRPVLAHQVLGDDGTEHVVPDQLDGVELVGGPEPVEEVHEGDAGAQRRGVGDQREVVGLLHRPRRQLREAGLAHRHHVLVVAEDGQALRRQGPRGHVEHRRGQLAGDLVHVRDHQQQALRGGEGGAQGAGLEGPVQGAGGAALALHLDHRRHRAPHVGAVVAGPLVGQLRHGRGGGDGVDGAQLAEPVGDVGRRLVAVDGRSHVSALRDELDGVHRALPLTAAAAGAQVVVEPVAVADAELDHRVLRAGAEAAVALEAVPAGQAAARLVARGVRVQAGDDLLERLHPGRRVEGGLLPLAVVAEVPQVQQVQAGHLRAWSCWYAPAPRSQASMLRAAFLPWPTPTVTVRSLGTASPPAKTPGAPVISVEGVTWTTSPSKSTPGTVARNRVSLSWPSARITVSASSFS